MEKRNRRAAETSKPTRRTKVRFTTILRGPENAEDISHSDPKENRNTTTPTNARTKEEKSNQQEERNGKEEETSQRDDATAVQPKQPLEAGKINRQYPVGIRNKRFAMFSTLLYGLLLSLTGSYQVQNISSFLTRDHRLMNESRLLSRPSYTTLVYWPLVDCFWDRRGDRG